MISEETLDAVSRYVEADCLGEEISGRLRREWPDIHFTYCQDDDISAAQPVRRFKQFNLYLVSRGEGCISFASEAERASGIVVAEVEEWEEDE